MGSGILVVPGSASGQLGSREYVCVSVSPLVKWMEFCPASRVWSGVDPGGKTGFPSSHLVTDLTSLSLHFLTCKMGIIIVPP